MKKEKVDGVDAFKKKVDANLDNASTFFWRSDAVYMLKVDAVDAFCTHVRFYKIFFSSEGGCI